MFERPKKGERAVCVHIDSPQTVVDDVSEFKELVASAGAEIVEFISGMRNTPEPKYFVGSGKAEEIRAATLLHNADVVIFNHSLSPGQERNLERLIKCRVLDRTGLILDIFAQRARSFEGKLQVELAQLEHLSTRLVRGWTHLERQKGGIGLRGPGEKQLETDRRLLRTRIKTINQRLARVESQRDQNRQARRRAAIPTVSIVGYTNAGKSTLFNSLTNADIYAADQLFATLDPTLRRLELSGSGPAILADTVGFIRHLPHKLVQAFRATLEETRDANLLLHIIDLSHPQWREQLDDVNEVLTEINAEEVPQILVFNKIDQCESVLPHIENDEHGQVKKVWISAMQNQGLDLLRSAISMHCYGDPIYRSLSLSTKQGKLRAQLYELDAVLSERVDDDGNWLINVCLARSDFNRLFPEYDPGASSDDARLA